MLRRQDATRVLSGPIARFRSLVVTLLCLLLCGALLTVGSSALAAPGDPSDPSTPTATTTTETTSASPTTTSTSETSSTGTTTTSTTPTTTSTEPTTTSSSSSPPPTDSSPPPSGGSEQPPAVPPPFSDAIEGASAGQEELAAEAMRLSQQVVVTSDQLAQLELEAEAAADSYRQAELELTDAESRAHRASVDAKQAERDLQVARDAVGEFARNTYISGSTLSSDLLLLDSGSPSELVERAGLLESVADSRIEALDQVRSAQARSDNADEVADEALNTKVNAESAARVALDESTATLAAQQETLTALLQQKADYDAEFYAALVGLLGPEGAAAAFASYGEEQLSQQAAEAAAREAAYGGGPVLTGQWALPLEGTLTSCYCERWGTMHWGIDIAAPMFTPEYAAGDGIVIQAGPATGFGQAVYIQHDNGDVTVYGHMEVIEVVTGQRVAAGQEIALVGSQGFSTGPHLHFEVHVGGINGTRVDPVIWLANRGIFV